ncbi:ABC transporter permease [Dolosigranulum pigrum]|jgi:hypothetical protein|uniref:ABC transporter permease n=1 Tax=Dolosigranulum pigrum TaxID=29394 RepID=UPI001AD87B80|nr:ABC transporter permease [Dolosigranulum pigrum]QTJ32277.1 ABC transporter permease [Dolosigranulum pigrum]
MKSNLLNNAYNNSLLQQTKHVSSEDFSFQENKLTDYADSLNTSNKKRILKRFLRSKSAMVSLIIIIVFIVVALFAPWLTDYSPTEQRSNHTNLPPKIESLSAYSWFDGKRVNRGGEVVDAYESLDQSDESSPVAYALGTDSLGRDMLTRIIYGIRISLLVSFSAMMINCIIGVSYGLISGWVGGKIDTLMQRALEVFFGIPSLVMIILLLLALKSTITSVVLAIALTSWMDTARVVRNQTLSLKEEEFILASKLFGQSSLFILFKHILPNIMGTLAVQIMMGIPFAIFYEAFLSFIGVGIPVPHASLGSLINDGYQTFLLYPHKMWYPAAAISIIMLAFNLLADGLRDAFDTKSEGG